MTTELLTFWSGDVSVDGQTKCSGGARPTLAECISANLADAIYYQAVYPSGKVEINLREHCSNCGGTGKVKKAGRVLFATKPCPACKDKFPDGTVSAIGPILLRLPDPTNGIRLVAHEDKGAVVELAKAREENKRLIEDLAAADEKLRKLEPPSLIV